MSRAKRERRAQKAVIRRWATFVIGNLRALLKREAPKVIAANPACRRPCHTCAFNPATDGDRGFDTTVWGLASAIATGVPFFCHENLPKDHAGEWLFDPRKAQLCAGYAMLTDALPAAKREIVRALVDNRPISDDKADAIAGVVLPTMPPQSDQRLAPGVTQEEAQRFLRAQLPRRDTCS